MAPRRALSAVLVAAALACAPGAASAADPPDADQVQRAASAFDAGSAAYREGRFEMAASQFEAADAAVRSPRALRMAMRSRDKAGQTARAATLAAQAKRLYPDDAKTVELADELLGRLASTLQRVDVRCAAPCVLAVGARVVPGDRALEAVIYLAPGTATVSASFKGGGDDRQVLKARAGGSNSLRFEPKVEPAKTAPDPAPRATTVVEPPPPPPAPPPDEPGKQEPGFLSSPILFFGALGATALFGGVTVWSGIDTVNNPGQDAVRQACAGKGTDCPEYQQGLAAQTRTNVLIGVTAGAAAITGAIGLWLTDWGGPAEGALLFGPGGASVIGRF